MMHNYKGRLAKFLLCARMHNRTYDVRAKITNTWRATMDEWNDIMSAWVGTLD